MFCKSCANDWRPLILGVSASKRHFFARNRATLVRHNGALPPNGAIGLRGAKGSRSNCFLVNSFLGEGAG
jgi:hypothetical protein